jgi:hypothetical protein
MRRRACAAVVVTALVTAACTGDGDGTADCTRTAPTDRSVARLWDEAVLLAVRTDFPEPPVHARNLYHSSAAMWDAWAAYDPVARGVFVDEEHGAGLDADELRAAREEAISFAAYRILLQRYLPSPGAEQAVTNLDELMASLCFDIDDTGIEGDDPAAIGNRIAAAILEHGLTDGSNEAGDYAPPDYEPVNQPLVVAEPGTSMVDPDRWQPLEIQGMVAQNGVPLTDPVQHAIGPHWGAVVPFALDGAADGGPPVDPGPPPTLADRSTRDELLDQVLEVISFSAALDPDDPTTIDISPAVSGNRPVGSYEAAGHPVNPATGEPYAPDVVRLGDYGRAVAEFWADGPRSETPPGHWNSIANDAVDALAALGPLRIGGSGSEVDRLEYDVKLYLALNGAVHDAAIAAWGLKGAYDSSRPISLVRHLGGTGELPLTPGLVEVVTAESSAPGERHAHLADHVGEIVIRAWLGQTPDSPTTAAGSGWIRAVEWLPYQRSTFVTPAFAAYVSGHSTFSRAAAEVLTAITGDPFFPGGLLEYVVDELEFEAGPTEPVTLRWATYRDAADEAGVSRLYGGIHLRADDLVGRVIGEQVGLGAWELARSYFARSDGAEP